MWQCGAHDKHGMDASIVEGLDRMIRMAADKACWVQDGMIVMLRTMCKYPQDLTEKAGTVSA